MYKANLNIKIKNDNRWNRMELKYFTSLFVFDNTC